MAQAQGLLLAVRAEDAKGQKEQNLGPVTRVKTQGKVRNGPKQSQDREEVGQGKWASPVSRS